MVSVELSKMRCFVPNCENTIGVPFPEDYELQNIWLKSLQITDGIPNIDSFVCFDHFDKNDVEEILNEEGSLEKRLRPNAVPRLFAIEDVIEKETEEFLEFRNQKTVTSESSPQLPDVSESLQEEQLTQSTGDATTEALPEQNVGDNTAQPEYVPQFQEFQTGDFILEQQEYSASHSSPQLYPTYSQDTETTPSQDQDVSQEPNLVIQENQDFLTVQHEFAPQQVFATEGQTFAPEGESVPIYTSQGQPVFNTEGQQVFVSESQPILTQEGHQVFISEEEQQHTSADDDSFAIKENPVGKNIKQEHMDAQDVLEGEHMDDQEMALDQQQIPAEQVDGVQSEERGVHEIDAAGFEGHQEELQAEQLFLERKPMITSNEDIAQNYPEVAQQAADQILIQEQPQQIMATNTTPPENIVMQWFVPNQPNVKPESITKPSELNTTTEDDNRIMISYQQEAGDPNSRIIQQHIVVSKGQETPSPVKMPRKERTAEVKEDCCRLCMTKDQVNVNILDNVKDNIMVLEAIQLCIHPLEISLEDPFSKKICFRCFNLLQKYFEFRQNCLKIDSDQKRAYEKAHPHYKFVEKQKPPHQLGYYPKKTHMRTIISPVKTGYRQTEVVTVLGPNAKGSGAKNVSRKVILTPTPKKKTQAEEIQYLLKDVNSDVGPNEKCVRQIISKVSKADDIQVFKLKKSNQSNQNGQSYPTKYTTVQKTPAIPISLSPKKFKASQIEALARKPPLSTAKQMKIQEELKKVIEGTMSKDDLSIDHVIVRVVSDDETEERVEHFPAKRKKYNVPIITTLEPKQEFSKMKIGRSEVVIPKGIRVSIPERFESSKGVFPCFPKLGAFGTEFSLINGYLFEYRLCKGNERFLRCVSASCSSVASQKLLPSGKFENKAYVKTSHNHQQLTSTEIKKQMFYYVMKKKMQADKGLNFRNVYDQICEKDPEIKSLVPLRNLINEICKHQLTQKMPQVRSFEEFYNLIEDDALQKYQFTYLGKQFYQERFTVKEEGTQAVIFANLDTIKKVSHSKLMYVDASFRIDTGESFSYQLVTVLVWVDDSYYPIMFALVSNRTMEIFKKVFSYLHDTLAPDLCPEEIVTDYEANIYYALGETYLESHIGGSVFYYTQNLYKKICELGLSRELETTSYFRNVYHMLLMLPLLPVNTIMDGLQNIEIQANDLGVGDTTTGLFEHIKEQWMEKVTPDLFCVHRLENRINENVIAPFKKLRDFLMLSKGKTQRQSMSIINVVEKLIDLENFLQTTYSSENKRSFGRDLSSSQKKNVLKAWQYIETHPKININHFFTKVIGYIKCMENQLWIWGYYKFSGKVTDDLINAANFSIVNTNESEMETAEGEDGVLEDESNFVYTEDTENTVVVEAVVGPSGEFVISNPESNQEDDSIFEYVYKK